MARKIDDQEIESRLHGLGRELRSRFTELEPRLALHQERITRQASLAINAAPRPRWPRIFIPLAAGAAAAAFALVLSLSPSTTTSTAPAGPLAVKASAEDEVDYFFANVKTDGAVFDEYNEAGSLAFEPESLDPEFPVYQNEEDLTDDYDNYEAS